jgi:hypothetical protein
MTAPVGASVIALIVSLSASLLSASEEDYLEWQSVQVSCFENKEAGKVALSALVADQGITSLTVTAFGRDYSVPESDLPKIRNCPLNSVRLTHEAGYAQLGGHMVHAKFRRSYYDQEKKLHQDETVISVSKGKGLVVSTGN